MARVDEAGNFAICCRHGVVIIACDIVQSGEK